MIPAYTLANYFLKNEFNVNLTTDERGLKYLKYDKNIKVINIPSSPFIKRNIFKLAISTSKIFFSIIKSIFY